MDKFINFSKPIIPANTKKYLEEVLTTGKLAGDNKFTKKCSEWLEMQTKSKKIFLTTSCTHALEMAAILLNIKEGDEVIMPSYTFSSTANAFILRGARIVFVDIRPDTMNIDEKLIEAAITKKTKAIIPVHYAGVSCEMAPIKEIASAYNIFIVEDAAQGMMATYKGKSLGTWGEIGAYSFHETKNYTCGEGGALLINHEAFIERAEIIREKGTNRTSFFRGEVDKYSWIDIGSSYLPGELVAAFLYAQLEIAQEIKKDRLNSWNGYYEKLKYLKEKGYIELPVIPEGCDHNAHMFYIKVKDLNERTKIIAYLRAHNIYAVFHYIPLHSSKAGLKHGSFSGDDIFTTKESERLLRLPLYYKITTDEIDYIVQKINSFFMNSL